jgi:hypothetical protein
MAQEVEHLLFKLKAGVQTDHQKKKKRKKRNTANKKKNQNTSKYLCDK